MLLPLGAIMLAELATACGQAVLLFQGLDDAVPAALRDGGTTGGAVAVYARTVASRDLLQQPGPEVAPPWRQMPPSAAAAAQQLFAVLRELDSIGVTEIWVETPPDASDWAGVRDRLARAAA